MVTEKSQHYEQDQYLKEHKLNHHSTSITVSDAHEEEPIIPSLGNPSKNSSTTDAITQRSRPRIIYPKIVIHGLHLLDIYCKTVSWRYRDDYFQRSVTEPEDYRASDLHDVILLRIVGMYLDPSVAIVIETHGNYYNWQIVDELKMDVDQVTFLEILEYPREECKTVFGNLFSDEEFYGIYDKVGGNAAKFKALFKIYHNIKEDEIPQYYQDKPFSRLKYAQSIYLIEEEDMFQRKLQSAHVLCAKYISQFKNLTMELPYDSMEVQFAMMDMIDAIFHYELQGVLHWTFIRHSDVQETPAGCALINSELFYIQFIHEQIRPYHDCYYNLIINWRDQRKKDWGVWNRIMYRWWRKLHGIGSLTVFTKWFRRKPQL